MGEPAEFFWLVDVIYQVVCPDRTYDEHLLGSGQYALPISMSAKLRSIMMWMMTR
jgi:hypothetical protein